MQSDRLRPLTRWMRMRSASVRWFARQLGVPIHLSTVFFEKYPSYPRPDIRHRTIHWIAYVLGLHVKIDGFPYGRSGNPPPIIQGAESLDSADGVAGQGPAPIINPGRVGHVGHRTGPLPEHQLP
jgi:hypothetical protein